MSKYLEAAAELIKKASDYNEENRPAGFVDFYRKEYAKLYALLAAIDKGLLPEATAEEVYGQLRGKQ